MSATRTTPNEFTLDQDFAVEATKVYRNILGASSSVDHYKRVEVYISQTAVTGASQTVKYELVERVLDPVAGTEVLSPIPCHVTVISGTVQVRSNGQTAITVAAGECTHTVAQATFTAASTGAIHLRSTIDVSGAVYLRVTGTVTPGTVTGKARAITGILGVN